MSVDLQDDVRQKLEVIHADINACRMCEASVAHFEKPVSMARGEPDRIVIVGQEPGRREIASQRAFSGRSGRRLDEWLVASGFDPAAPRRGVYATSVAKCLCEKPKLGVLYRNCSRFLDRQLSVIRPSLIISLGAVAYKAVRFNKIEFKDAVCKLYRSDAESAGFRTKFGFDYALMIWPHPSPGSRWHNSPENRRRLQECFDALKAHLAAEAAAEESVIV
jgi:uracil-DNA glycosylase family 4